MRKSLSLFGVALPAMLITGAHQADALTITQLSNQTVENGAPITACVDVSGALTANGTPVGPFPCNNQLNEQWIFSNGWFLGIGTTGFGTGAVNKCLSVKGNSTAAGAHVELDTCVPGNLTQLWVVTSINGHSEIFNEGSQKCLDSLDQIGSALPLVLNGCSNPPPPGQLWDLK